MAAKRKPTYEQALGLQAGQAAARRAARERAARLRPAPPAAPVSDGDRLEAARRYSTEELVFRLRKARASEADLAAMRAVLAERD